MTVILQIRYIQNSTYICLLNFSMNDRNINVKTLPEILQMLEYN